MTDQERATVSDARDDLPFIVHSQLDDLDLDPFEFRAYAHMVRRAGLGKNGGAGEHWESIEKSAKHCRMDVKTYRRALRGLVERRLVTREDRVGQTSVYRLTPPRAWRPLPETAGVPNPAGVPETVGVPLPETEGVPLPETVDKGNPNEGNPKKGSSTPPTPPTRRATPRREGEEDGGRKRSAAPTPPAEAPPDLEDLTHYQRRQLERPPDRLTGSQLATEFPRAWAQLANFRRLHARPVPEAQFVTWASAVLDDAREHGDALVAAALQVTSENFPNLNQPFAFYRGCIRRAAVDAGRPGNDQPAGEVMSQDDLDRIFALAKEGELA